VPKIFQKISLSGVLYQVTNVNKSDGVVTCEKVGNGTGFQVVSITLGSFNACYHSEKIALKQIRRAAA